jgi:hypothetical protein
MRCLCAYHLRRKQAGFATSLYLGPMLYLGRFTVARDRPFSFLGVGLSVVDIVRASDVKPSVAARPPVGEAADESDVRCAGGRLSESARVVAGERPGETESATAGGRIAESESGGAGNYRVTDGFAGTDVDVAGFGVTACVTGRQSAEAGSETVDTLGVAWRLDDSGDETERRGVDPLASVMRAYRPCCQTKVTARLNSAVRNPRYWRGNPRTEAATQSDVIR